MNVRNKRNFLILIISLVAILFIGCSEQAPVEAELIDMEYCQDYLDKHSICPEDLCKIECGPQTPDNQCPLQCIPR